MHDHDAQLTSPAVARVAAILAARGIDPVVMEVVNRTEPAQASVTDVRIPHHYREATADHPAVAAWVSQIIGTVRRGPGGRPEIARGPSLLVAGATGTGKAHQAYGVVRSLLAAGVRLRWDAVTAADLYAALRPRAGYNGEQDLNRLARCPLLIVDDLGAAKASQWTEEITYRLVNHRYEQTLPAVFTTNLLPAELRAHAGDRVASRLTEMTDRVFLEGGDRRRAIAAARREGTASAA